MVKKSEKVKIKKILSYMSLILLSKRSQSSRKQARMQKKQVQDKNLFYQILINLAALQVIIIIII